MNHMHISSKFYLSLLEFSLKTKQHLVAISASHDLTSMQAATLLLLDDHTPRPMKNLSVLFQCDASNVTGLVDGLEQKGLVERLSDPNDRRIKTIRICPAGKKLQQRILQQLTSEGGHLFDPLTESETEQFSKIIEKLAPPK